MYFNWPFSEACLYVIVCIIRLYISCCSKFALVKYIAMTKDIFINTNQKNSYGGGLVINVTEVKHWDPLSKIFKKYTHAIEYSTSARYNTSEYTINVFARGLRNFVFIYKNPSQKVEKVEVYFKGDHNILTEDPLVVGFIYQKNTKYYTWSKLKSTRNSTGTITDADSISEKDLVTVLLEELGTSIHRPRKLVIRLGEKPDRGREVLQYPDSGYYSELNRKITVRKVEGSGVPGVEGYEHNISSSIPSVSDFYVTYLNNSVYFESESMLRVHYLLEKVTAYFKNGSKNLVLIMFTLTSKSSYVYEYSQFVKDLKTNPSEVKEIGQLNVINPYISLLPILKKERERLTQLIEFQKGDGTGGNKNVKRGIEQNVDPDNVRQGYKFKKVSMTPDASDGDKPDGSSGGPSIVYNNHLFTGYETGKNIPDDVLTRNGIFTYDTRYSSKYQSITVFYALTGNSNEHKALLVEFDASNMETKTYFKRTNNSGSSWEIATEINSDDTGVTGSELTQIAKDAGVIEDITTTISTDGISSNRSAVGESGSVRDFSRSSDGGVANTTRDPAVASTGVNHSVSDSRTTYGQASQHTEKKKDGESDDISKTVKIAGAGVATTAIGAGAIGGGGYYAHAVASLTHWLI